MKVKKKKQWHCRKSGRTQPPQKKNCDTFFSLNINNKQTNKQTNKKKRELWRDLRSTESPPRTQPSMSVISTQFFQVCVRTFGKKKK